MGSLYILLCAVLKAKHDSVQSNNQEPFCKRSSSKIMVKIS